MIRVFIFGNGENGKLLYKYLKLSKTIEVLGIIDNNCCGKGIIRPSDIKSYSFDQIIVSVSRMNQRREIGTQLKKIGINNKKIHYLLEDEKLMTEVFSSFNRYNEDTDSRLLWLKAHAQWIRSFSIPGNVAECGVNRGEFAEYINKYFKDRELYLFDTFNGFHSNDLNQERLLANKFFIDGDFNNEDGFHCTNINIVKNRMPHLEKCRFCEGYFPETAIGIEDEFCFVNLDMDLYKPMYDGLVFFYPKMVSNGVILLHDYFHPQLPGVKRAVEDYEKNNNTRLRKFVIGDGCSIAIVK